ncbi:hypothetical protein EGW08_019918 [Elysia chlorotica]|uniref:Uncharacterized protein n=1 Tax=Elysia chlorotica TaxID=188477 RepID=A0A433SST7_ELYCH|nr:hypothetical protein EGW08_019918 [Elysia chlorotica]
MPKRNNPFGDHSSLQLKTHVGEKEVDKGVCKQTRMQTVYERTQALLFKGMKQNTDSDMAVDVNDNHTSYGSISCDAQHSEKSSLKQMHLNKNCEIVAESVEMETDFDVQEHQRETFLKLPSSFVFHAPAADHCETSTLPTFGFNFGRSSGSMSPSDHRANCSEKYSHERNQRLEQSSQTKNAFSLLMQSHVKNAGSSQKSLCQACHNCRHPVSVRDIVKCQFCEQYICSGCMRQCQGCFLHYCQLCSMMNYEQVTERAFCLTCSGR